MKNRHLNLPGKGEWSYDYQNDILYFKIRGRQYARSLDFENLSVDFDTEHYITGISVEDASSVFHLNKIDLKFLKDFSFHAAIEEGQIRIQLQFSCIRRNKPIISKGQDIVRPYDLTLPLGVTQASA